MRNARLRNATVQNASFGTGIQLLGLAAVLFLTSGSHLRADPPAGGPALPMGTVPKEAWLKASTAPLEPGELDALVNRELEKAGISPSTRIDDAAFVRRVYIDLTGRLPVPADVRDFVASKQADKRARLVDRLLASDEFARHWAAYWRNLITSRNSDFRTKLFASSFETWLAEQFKQNRGWGDITTDILTASGAIRNDKPGENGQAFFLTSRIGADATTELAAEASRIFLGVQIQCAQCHDHPSDIWKRDQFHEFAAFFARIRQRPVREGDRLVGTELVALGGFREHMMPDSQDPKRGKRMVPRYLDGTGPGKFVSDKARRSALADAVVSGENPWFAAAFVNRAWFELMGHTFYSPVDDLGPMKEAVMLNVIARVSGSFRGSEHDIKQLFRDIMVSDTYQRSSRPGEKGHQLFAANNPRRLQADVLWQSLSDTLGQLAPPAPGGRLPFRQFNGLQAMFTQAFEFDPSSRPEEVEGSVSQALILMNNLTINQRIEARGSNLLARILKAYPRDEDAIRMVYQRTLVRQPSERELSRCQQHLRTVGNRSEAYEDILWALINSTEYQTRR